MRGIPLSFLFDMDFKWKIAALIQALISFFIRISFNSRMYDFILNIFILLFLFQSKHFFADFIIQSNYMMKKGELGWSFFLPLCIHSASHAILSIVICLFFNPEIALICGGIDFTIHFIVDRFKSSEKYLGRFNNPNKKSFWVALGFDQYVHHLTNYLIIYLIIKDLSI